MLNKFSSTDILFQKYSSVNQLQEKHTIYLSFNTLDVSYRGGLYTQLYIWFSWIHVITYNYNTHNNIDNIKHNFCVDPVNPHEIKRSFHKVETTTKFTCFDMYALNIRTAIYQYVRVNKSFCPTLRTQHTSTQNHYEILNVKPNCTAKEIRDSFVKLSKETHPDTSENTMRNADRFRAIVEAYRVLGKADSRAVYDLVVRQGKGPYAVYNYYEPSQSSPDKNHSGASTGYYGVFGSKRISNKRVVMYCMIFMFAGVIVQAFAIRHSVTIRREKLDRVSMEAEKSHSRARADADEYGNDNQLKKLVARSENSRK